MNQNRRSFLMHGALAAAPWIFSAGLRAAQPGPNRLLRMAFVGIGAQGRQLLQNFLGMPVQVVALCDVDSKRRNDAVARVEQFHKDHPDKGAFDCKGYQDFREIMARADIDAVCIATPDHWHALITLSALEAGKDVYCEKPLTHNIHEAITVMAAVKRHGRVLQTGSMQRSMSEFRVACELVRNGVIGKVQRVICKVGGPPRKCDLAEEPMEPGLDWDRWLGPAPLRPYHSKLSPRGAHAGFPPWRDYLEYGGGGICDFGAHHFDIAQWGLGMDGSGPVKVCPPADADAMSGALVTYANGVTLLQSTAGDIQSGVTFIGSEGEVQADRGSFKLVLKEQTIIQAARAEKEFLTDAKIRLLRTSSHAADFLARVADRKRPVASEIEGGHTAILCHLINLAYLHRKTLKWDPKQYQFVDGTGEKSWLTRDYRKPWKV